MHPGIPYELSAKEKDKGDYMLTTTVVLSAVVGIVLMGIMVFAVGRQRPSKRSTPAAGIPDTSAGPSIVGRPAEVTAAGVK